MTVLSSIAVAMVAGLLMTRVINLLRLPDVTAYLIAGILIGPHVLGRLGVQGLGFPGFDLVSQLDILSNLALGFIAFAIGTEFMLPKLRKIGRQAVVIAIFQACLASVLVACALIGLHFLMPEKLSLPAAIVLGAVASATAPAATLMVVRQYKARGAVTLTVALSMLEFDLGGVKLGFSSLLVCMMLGTVFCNLCPIAEDLMEREDRWTAPIYCLFFVLSGSALRLDVFSDWVMVLTGVIYIIFRSAGKYLGARWSAQATRCDSNIVKYLGITLLPQAGVALGMSLTASQLLGGDGAIIRSITLFSVLIYELVGPLLTKLALTASGDIRPKSAEITGRREKLLAQAQERSKAE